MRRLLVFGPGYTASRIAAAMAARDWEIVRIGRAEIDDSASVERQIATCSHILSSVPPAGEDDPVLLRHADALARGRAWTGYLSSTGVYGDTGGAWVDESAPVGLGRRTARAAADQGWLAIGARVFRLPGIYGPGRSPLDRIAEGGVYRIDQPGQVFSRIHVDDIVSALVAGLDAEPGAYNIADDLPAAQSDVTAYAAKLMGVAPPPFVPIETLSPAARAFYAENRRIANGKAKRALGWVPAYPSYREGLRALRAISSPAKASAAPAAAISDQR